MSNFQTMVRQTQTVARPGVIVEAESTYKLSTSRVAGDDSVMVGNFVRVGTNAGEAIGPKGTTKIIGVAIFDRYFSSDAPSMMVPVGSTFQILQAGVIAILNTSGAAAVVDQYVGIEDASGDLKLSTTAPTAGTTDTGFRVRQAGANNEIIFISTAK